MIRLARTLSYLRPDAGPTGRLARPPRFEQPGLRGAVGAPGSGPPRAAEFSAPGAQRSRRRAAGGPLRVREPRGARLAAALGAPERRLWAYNLHYFGTCFALLRVGARAGARRWIARHRCGATVGWGPIGVARVGIWCPLLQGLGADPLRRGFSGALWQCPPAPGGWLAGHTRGPTSSATTCRERRGAGAGRRVLCGQRAGAGSAPATAAARGSTSRCCRNGHQALAVYHARTTWLLDALARSGTSAGPPRRLPGPAARRWPRCVTRTAVPLLNDSVFGVANRPGQLMDAPRPGPFALPDTGYYGARGSEGHYLICDAAPIGPDYLPGHAHGDLFSFELSLRGRRLIVDSGVSSYEPDAERAYARSTRAQHRRDRRPDQCEFWSAFPRGAARPPAASARTRGGGFELGGWHDGRASARPRAHAGASAGIRRPCCSCATTRQRARGRCGRVASAPAPGLRIGRRRRAGARRLRAGGAPRRLRRCGAARRRAVAPLPGAGPHAGEPAGLPLRRPRATGSASPTAPPRSTSIWRRAPAWATRASISDADPVPQPLLPSGGQRAGHARPRADATLGGGRPRRHGDHRRAERARRRRLRGLPQPHRAARAARGRRRDPRLDLSGAEQGHRAPHPQLRVVHAGGDAGGALGRRPDIGDRPRPEFFCGLAGRW